MSGEAGFATVCLTTVRSATILRLTVARGKPDRSGRRRLEREGQSLACRPVRKDAGGSRTHLDRVAAGCLAVWLQRHRGDVLARSRTWSTTFGGSRANPSHSKGDHVS